MFGNGFTAVYVSLKQTRTLCVRTYLVSRLEACPPAAALPDVEGERVGGLVDGALVHLVDRRLVRVRVHVVGAV